MLAKGKIRVFSDAPCLSSWGGVPPSEGGGITRGDGDYRLMFSGTCPRHLPAILRNKVTRPKELSMLRLHAQKGLGLNSRAVREQSIVEKV